MAPSAHLTDESIGKLLSCSGTKDIPTEHIMATKKREGGNKPRWAERVVWNKEWEFLLVKTHSVSAKWPSVMLFYPSFSAEDWEKVSNDPGHLAWVKARASWFKRTGYQCGKLRMAAERSRQHKETCPRPTLESRATTGSLKSQSLTAPTAGSMPVA